MISAEFIGERASTVSYANAATSSDHTLSEEMLKSSLASTLEDLQRVEEDSQGNGAGDDYGISL